jgi:hypothetical protein
VAGTAGCTGLDLPELRYRTEHVDVAPGFEEPVCRGSLALLDRHAEFLHEALALDPDERDQRIRFYWLEDLAEACGDGASGCTKDHSVYARWGTVFHEMVHALTWGWGEADRLVEEGVAVAFEGHAVGFGTRAPSTQIGLGVDDPIDYFSAGHFVRYLLTTHGLPRMKAFYRRTRRGDRQGLLDAFHSVYGRTLAEVEDAYYREAPELYPGMTWCEHPLLAWEGPRWEHDVRLSCEGSLTRAPEHPGDPGMYTVIALDVSEPGDHALSVSGSPEEGLVQVDKCPVELSDYDESWTVPAGSSARLRLRPGRHRLLFRATSRQPASFLVGIERQGTTP